MDKCQGFKDRIFKNMAYIEKMQGDLFHNLCPNTERKFWECANSKDHRGLAAICQHLDKYIDDLNQCIEDSLNKPL